MPGLDLSRPIVSGAASFQAGDWAGVSGSAGLNVMLAATFDRGINISAGAEALVQLDANFRKFLSAELNGEAHAAAKVRAQVQVPLDLFNEAGLAIRLQAVAEAAVGVRAALGLSIRDFLDVADRDPRLKGAPARLLRVILEETTIEGGVYLKAAVAAMAYVNLAFTARLVPGTGAPPGFTVAAEAGLGLKAGAGFRVYANFGLADPRRLIRRSIDIGVDETLAAIRSLVPDQRPLIDEVAGPVKMALRAVFEIGSELAQAGAFDPGAGPRLAQRCAQVFLEEAQRAILGRAVEAALGMLRQAFPALPFTTAQWNSAAATRNRLAATLRSLPDEPFEPTAANLQFWTGLASDAADLGLTLSGSTSTDNPIVRGTALLWSALQLLFVAVSRITEASARASVIGVPPAQIRQAFSGTPVSTPPVPVRTHINQRLGRVGTTALDQSDLVQFLLDGVLDEIVLPRYPELHNLIQIVSGNSTEAIADGLSVILSNIGAFVPGPGNQVDPVASLRAIVSGIQAYANTRLVNEFVPIVRQAALASPEVGLYVDEVLLPTLTFTVDTLFETVLTWSAGNSQGQAALREACSAILMKLFGRSLVVTGDILLDHAMRGVGTSFRDAALHVNDAGGIAQNLAGLAHLDQSLVAEAIEETLQIAADAFTPLSDAQRARIRDLLYRIIDTAPAVPDAAFVEQLKSAGFVPNFQAASDLTFELGELLGERLINFVGALLQHVAEIFLRELAEVVDELARQIALWIGDLEALESQLAAQAVALLNEIGHLTAQMEEQFDVALSQAADLFDALSTNAGRNRLRTDIHSVLNDGALAALEDNPAYVILPDPARRIVREALSAATTTITGTHLLDPLLDAVAEPLEDLADFFRDVRDIEPDHDLTQAITDLFLDRLEDAVNDSFGGDFEIPVAFRAYGSYDPPELFGIDLPPITVDLEFDLGTIVVPVSSLISVLRNAASELGVVETAVRDLATALVDALESEAALACAQTEHAAASAQHDTTRKLVDESWPAQVDADILEPGPGSIITGDVRIAVSLSGVPRSFLGLADHEAQRVFVSLNHVELPLSEFVITEVGGQPPTLSGLRPRRLSVPGIGWSGALVLENSRSMMVRQPPIAPASRTGNSGRPIHPLADALAGARGQQSFADRKGRRGSGTSRQRGQIRSTPGRTDGRRLHSPISVRLPVTTIGRPPRPSDVERVTPVDFPGIQLRIIVPFASLTEGINALCVAVVDGRNRHRAERTVSFAVVAPAASTSGTNIRMPGRWQIDRGKIPPALLDKLQDVLGTVPDSAPAGERRVKRANWLGRLPFAPRAERAHRLAATKLSVNKRFPKVRATVADVAAAFKSGALRPGFTRRNPLKPRQPARPPHASSVDLPPQPGHDRPDPANGVT